MEPGKKFGTFGGVFTPSVLTILGVIMYLRLGWVVGQAGLYYTVGIILVAHIISITTGLSLSSIATDKKIKSGGIYYMLSRSLGLPMGGAIGATIFLATALSISLYIVGFAESFLAIDSVREFLNLDMSINSYRIIGTITLITITIVAFISTSLAINIQYFVLAAIALSLVSIFGGLFVNEAGNSIAVSIDLHSGAPPIDVIFAVFFPAVTGFTVGVAMSGDLRNPKKSIPLGTLLSIFTGLLIYLGLSVSMAFFVDRDMLISDSGFLLKVALYSPLVVAGIWGATLSSALGGILGGPRIIQALAKDKLAPSWIKKGYGVNNEPRIAVIITFVIAQAGILLGDLNTIASVVSMFFIAAYGFINLAFALESWASSDFRPSFRVPAWVGWTGFAFSFLVMMQIDMVSMVIAFVLIWITYFIMKKNEQKLDLGDVWQSVWSSVVRHSLHNMNTKGIEDRNWRPNIILFTGNPQTRPYLFDLGTDLIGKHGFLTSVNIKLINKNQKIPSRNEQIVKTPESENHKGVFSREYFYHDFYDGIKNVAETYGFAGVEPNTVLLGWARESTDPLRFVKLINHMINLDLNLLFLDFDHQKGFGKRKTIDIWWRGAGNNGNLAINLVKFLWISENWRESKTRLLIENPVNDERDNIFTFASEVLSNLRVSAEIVIINNELDRKSFYDIVRVESLHSDIIFIGMPDIEEGNEHEFVQQTNDLCRDIGTVILVKASTQFKKLNIGIKSSQVRPHLTPIPANYTKKTGLTNVESSQMMPNWQTHPHFHDTLKNMWKRVSVMYFEWHKKGFQKAFLQYQEIINNAGERVKKTFDVIANKYVHTTANQPGFVPGSGQTVFYKLSNNSFIRYEQILQNFPSTLLEEQKWFITLSFQKFHNQFLEYLKTIPADVTYTLSPGQLQILKQDTPYTKFFKWRKKTFSGKTTVHRINLQKIALKYFPVVFHGFVTKIWEQFGLLTFQYLQEQQRAFELFRKSLSQLEIQASKGTLGKETLEEEEEKISDIFYNLSVSVSQSDATLFAVVEKSFKDAFQEFSKILMHPDPLHIARKSGVRKTTYLDQFDALSQKWSQNQQLIINRNMLEITLASVSYKVSHILYDVKNQISEVIHSENNYSLSELPQKIISFCDHTLDCLKKKRDLPEPSFQTGNNKSLNRRLKDSEDYVQEKISAVISKVPSSIELIGEQSFHDFYARQYQTADSRKIEVSRLLHFIIQNDLIAPVNFQIENYVREVLKLNHESQEIAGLIKITLIGDKEEPLNMEFSEFLQNQKQRILEISDKYNKLTRDLYDKIENALNKSARQMEIKSFLKTAENLKLYVKEREQQKEKTAGIERNWNDFKEYVNNNLVKIWYDRSKRVVFAHEIQIQENFSDDLPINQIPLLSDQLSVKKYALQKVPPYYQHLFLRKNNYFMDFWYGRQKELSKAYRLIKRHDNGMHGAIIVRGEHYSGKSFFVNYFTNRFLTTRQVFTVNPPLQGSISEADFLRSLQKATQRYVSADKILKNLPRGSVIVLEDLELWWEKTSRGFVVIDLIFSLLKKYTSHIVFILPVNVDAYRTINRVRKFGDHVLGIIDCVPFHAEELKNIVMQRHKAGNLKFDFHGKKEEEMRSWDYAQLFNNYFNFTKGNVGLCLQTWMASVQQFKNQRIVIDQPRKPDLSALGHIVPENLVIMVQFVLHKTMTHHKMERVMQMSPPEVEAKIKQLKLASLIVEVQEGVFILNPGLHSFMKNLFAEKELL